MAEIKNFTIKFSSGITCAAQKLACLAPVKQRKADMAAAIGKFMGVFSSGITCAAQKLACTEIYREPALVQKMGRE